MSSLPEGSAYAVSEQQTTSSCRLVPSNAFGFEGLAIVGARHPNTSRVFASMPGNRRMPRTRKPALVGRLKPASALNPVCGVNKISPRLKRYACIIETGVQHRAVSLRRISRFSRAVPSDVHASMSSDYDAGATDVPNRDSSSRNRIHANGIGDNNPSFDLA
ncbi:MAG: hypothetical protein M3Y72_04335 [Acidobacteriota bacterium]|nr:hypothetical protein [Acidobacteriota bacterium]